MAKKYDSIRWRQGRYRPRGANRKRKPPKPRPILDSLLAVGSVLLLALAVLTIATPFAVNLRVPVYLAYGLIMPLLAVVAIWLGPRDRNAIVVVGMIVFVWIGGATALYLARDKIKPASHYHHETKSKPETVTEDP
ncbi:MAG: hypothetical protein K5831_10215 [Brevundimonas sp.]|uniref:hypothetical protein n=1 Tax=Brevundimonas sp. TaxID=1871086 RepID=UPI0025835DBC|nr:hypothetical protein [Brevundimonas sp.]MCV0415242.1 hypothetical protein [Brevundimonas sp.]